MCLVISKGLHSRGIAFTLAYCQTNEILAEWTERPVVIRDNTRL